jgi:hypothetical protein
MMTISSVRYSPKILIGIPDLAEIDFVGCNADLQQLLRRLQELVMGAQYFLPLGTG